MREGTHGGTDGARLRRVGVGPAVRSNDRYADIVTVLFISHKVILLGESVSFGVTRLIIL